MPEPVDLHLVQQEDVGAPPLNPRTVLLVRKSELEDALEAAEVPQRARRRLGLGFLGAGVLFTGVAIMGDPQWHWLAWGMFSYPIFGAGWYLMAQQEIGQLKREVKGVEAEIESLGQAPGKERIHP